MKATSLSFFRFNRLADKLWAFSQMQFARRPLARIPEIGFHKLLGTGTGEGFHPYPNFAVYAILATWPSLEVGRARVAEDRLYARYRSRAVENWTVFLEATQCRGRWDNAAPFEVSPEPQASPGGLIAVLTRASVKPRHVLEFWRQVPGIRKAIRTQDQLVFQHGLGEIPWLHQVTFSIWRDRRAMEAFARTGCHRHAVGQVRKGDWFAEELFARFRVLHAEGRWEGVVPIAPAEVAQEDDAGLAVHA